MGSSCFMNRSGEVQLSFCHFWTLPAGKTAGHSFYELKWGRVRRLDFSRKICEHIDACSADLEWIGS
jgi:hypothetical protein